MTEENYYYCQCCDNFLIENKFNRCDDCDSLFKLSFGEYSNAYICESCDDIGHIFIKVFDRTIYLCDECNPENCPD